ncbi:MAG: NlpC/P60 family protein [Ktedonobacterales bacterium]
MSQARQARVTADGAATQAVAVGVANVHREPDAAAELVTQALLHTPARVLTTGAGWTRVRLPDYEGWVPASALAALPETSDRVAVVTAPKAALSVATERDAQASEAVYATTVLPLLGAARVGWLPVALAGGRAGHIAAGDVALRPAIQPFPAGGAPAAVAHALRYRDVPYLWGGTTIEGVDCSGLVQLCWRAAGATIPRDADQQFEALAYIAGRGELRAGDLVFFAAEGAITHVGLMLDHARYIHAKGAPQSAVIVSSFDPNSVESLPRLTAMYAGARRVLPVRAE